MMKCNLIPPEYGKPPGLWMKPLTLGFLAMAVLFLAGGTFFQYQIRQEKIYYQTVLQPIQETIKGHNDRIRQGQALVEQQAKLRQDSSFSWPVLIVDLALSKPDTVVVTKVSGRDTGAVIEGVTATSDGAQKWQRSLQSRGRYKAAVTRMQPKSGESIPFSLEVICHEDKS
ncbi:hypothetical protein [uncultured Megasphaera sp.]|uniref:hypothetical protein n=1 Tax=uncultured Megasphaera sp. TaxID=165188 RepID=UPI0025FD862D|nr:hypothetical protein [uncultured Megasphaera sp.]